MRKFNSHVKLLMFFALTLAVLAGPLKVISRAADQAPATVPGKRTPEQVKADLQAVSAELAKALTSPQDLFDGAKRKDLAPKLVPLLKRMVSILDELGQVGAHTGPELAQTRLQFLAILSLLDDDEATAALAKGAQSRDAQQAMGYRGIQFLVRWWKTDGAADAQTKILDEVQALARENPENDSLAQTIMLMLGQNVTSAEVRQKAEDILINDLRGMAARHLAQQIQARRKLTAMEGKPLTIEGVKVDGTRFTSADWKGKVVLVDFWATWCRPCINELPKVKKVYADYHDKGLEIVGISCDRQAADLTKFLEQNPDMPWPQLFEKNKDWHPIATEMGVTAIPAMFLIDRKGIVRSVSAREDYEQMIPKLLAEKAR